MTDTTTQAVERKYLIRKYGAYYRPNSRGYTGSAIQAGRYTLEEAEDLTHPNGKNGPRDSMSYIHEDGIACLDWQAYSALLAERDAIAAQLAAAELRARESAMEALAAYGQAAEAHEAQLAAEAMLTRAYEAGRDDAARLVDNSCDEFDHPATHYTFGRIADAIRDLAPPADLADRVKGGGE